MACKTSYSWSHNFPRLAADAGFCFTAHRPRVIIDWNSIKLVDIDSLIRERNFVTVEQHINDVLDCILESEFDLKILDDGVVKLFRLAQLAIEYQQFCKQYLDRSVVVLKNELTSAMQELEKIRKEIRIKDDEIRKLRKKSKHTYRPPLPYGNENIATMILRTLSSRGDIHMGTSIGEAVPHYNKCPCCDKVFLNQLYLQSHISRRHTQLNGLATEFLSREQDAPDLPEKLSPKINSVSNETNLEIQHLQNEIKTLTAKLKETEFILNSKAVQQNDIHSLNNGENNTTTEKSIHSKDKTFMDQFEEWKQKEHDKYQSEISELRHQLLDNINAFKETALSNAAANDNRIMEQLKITVKEQENQINKLKEDLSKVPNSSLPQNEISKELLKQEESWRTRMEQIDKQHEQKLDQLLRTLETVYREVKAAREIGEAERAKVIDLQALLQQKDNTIKHLQEQKTVEKEETTSGLLPTHRVPTPEKNTIVEGLIKKQRSAKNFKFDHVTSKQTLQELHRKAQELLSSNMETVSDSSDSPQEESPNKIINKNDSKIVIHSKTDVKNHTIRLKPGNDQHRKTKKKRSHGPTKLNKADVRYSFGDSLNTPTKELSKKSKQRHGKHHEESESGNFENDTNIKTSPAKVIRAKLTEEVNSRLLHMGVDPLRSGVPPATFNKQRTLLQYNQDVKAKNNASYSKMRNRILTYLDTKVSKEDVVSASSPQISPNKQVKNFRMSSLFSNVKHKAIALMKSSDRISKIERNVLNDQIAKKAALLLKTPPGSAPSSPAVHRRSSFDSRELQDRVKRVFTRSTNKMQPPKSQSMEVLFNHRDNNKISEKVSGSDNDDILTDSSASVLSSSEDLVDTRKKKSEVKVVTSAVSHEPSKSIESLIKSPIRKLATKNVNSQVIEYPIGKYITNKSPARPSSAIHKTPQNMIMYEGGSESDAEVSVDMNIVTTSVRKFPSEENLLTRSSPTSPKGVLKNAPSISSLSKKKVLFDLEANQMKSVSASPSQSVTDGNNRQGTKYTNADQVINLSNDWEISSIEDVPMKETKTEDTITLESRKGPKIAELTQRIESQLARRSTAKKPVGAVEVIPQSQNLMGSGNPLRSGSNTSVGSSLLDDSNDFNDKNVSPSRSKTPVPAPRFVSKSRLDKDGSDLDISDWSLDDILKEKKV